jgi:hypothetical protein
MGCREGSHLSGTASHDCVNLDHFYAKDVFKSQSCKEWVTSLWYILMRGESELDNMPDLVQYLISNISELPQASHSYLGP